MAIEKVDILGIDISNVDLPSVLSRAEEIIQEGQRAMLVTANPEIIMLARRDPDFAQILGAAEMVTADGIGLVIASKLLGSPLKARVTGIDLADGLFRQGAGKGYRFYLLGAHPDVVERAVKNIENQYVGLKIAGFHHGYFDRDDEILADIKQARPQILLVALGMGKQEKWIRRNQSLLGVNLAIGIGGSFDVFAGAAKRAPAWMQKMGLEWLYRLIKQPSRFVRMLELPKFLMLVLVKRLKGRQAF